jgi:ATP-dependent helicase/nuclease subunit B
MSPNTEGPDANMTATVAEPPWDGWLLQLERRMAAAGTIPSRVVVLLPYAQMMAEGRRAWVVRHPSGLSPRFETTRNWAAALGPFLPSGDDLTGDMARDSLVAAALLDQVAGRRTDRSLHPVLVSRLVEMARQMAPLAAARPPAERAAWAQSLMAELVPSSQTLQWEGLLASLALTWAGHSAYPTDALWASAAEPGVVADLLLVIPGFQEDPLAQALLDRWGSRGDRLMTELSPQAPDASPAIQLHASADAHDEAERAAACVLAHLRGGRRPVALVATDRLLTRQVTAMLAGRGLVQTDETGWRLSTTHAAAKVLALLRAASPRASLDDVLGLLKVGDAWPQDMVDRMESQARRYGTASWTAARAHPKLSLLLPDGFSSLLDGLQPSRPLDRWLAALREGLSQCGWEGWFAGDAAGQQLWEALRLGEGRSQELSGLQGRLAAGEGGLALWTLTAFTGWVRQVLESVNFTPDAAACPDVVVLPMAQLLGRQFGAVVAAGCDEVRLPASPELPGQWSAAQRAQLGLPSRDTLAQAALQAWQHLLAQPAVDILWRTQDQAEPVLPAPWLRPLLEREGGAAVLATDPRVKKAVQREPVAPPAFSASELLPSSLSASAYQDLRDCPYRFMALRQWRLKEDDELDDTPDKRDMGLWLHAVLGRFHEERRDRLHPDEPDDQRLDRIAREEAQARGLWAMDGSGSPGFLPFLAAWPTLRQGYLSWLEQYEASPDRPVFEQAEAALSSRAGQWRLVGHLDRVDVLEGGMGAKRMVIDYKTEPRDKTRGRVAQPLEDTQLAFYAALVDPSGNDEVRGAYLSIQDSASGKGVDGPTRLFEQTDLARARDALLRELPAEMDRIAQGHVMLALGEGSVCEYCSARGLCRKDFWEPQP